MTLHLPSVSQHKSNRLKLICYHSSFRPLLGSALTAMLPLAMLIHPPPLSSAKPSINGPTFNM